MLFCATTALADDATELATRRAALTAQDVKGRMELAVWAREKQLWNDVASLAREVLDREPNYRDAFNMLLECDRRNPIPDDPKLEATLASAISKAMGHPFKSKSTRHFILVYDTPEEFSSRCASQVEAAYDAFMVYLNSRSIHPNLLTRRLVVVLYAKRADFQNYAKLADGSELPLAGGYYSGATNFVAFYDDSSSEEAVKLEGTLKDSIKKSNELAVQIDDASRRGQTGLVNTLSVERARIEQWISATRADHQAHAGRQNASKTMHEAAHQLSFNTGVQVRNADYPMWLSEGLATQFETTDRTGRVDPLIVNPTRLSAFREAQREKKMISLETLIMENPPASVDNKTMNIWYGASWAFFHYLYEERRGAIEKIFAAYQKIGASKSVSPEERKRIVVEACGEKIETLEKKFLAYVKALPEK
jgi:hypothetical protein